jgi:hypothetical protein
MQVAEKLDWKGLSMKAKFFTIKEPNGAQFCTNFDAD